MFNLLDKNISYIIISPSCKTDYENKIVDSKLSSILYSKDYTIIPIKGYQNNIFENSYIAIPESTNNDRLRCDGLFIIDEFSQNNIIIKYSGDQYANKMSFDGSEKPLGIVLYDSNNENKSYFYNGLSFSFIEKKRYFFPSKKEDLKSGMVIEYFNNSNKWVEKKINNVDLEYKDMYKLLIKYDKLRIPY